MRNILKYGAILLALLALRPVTATAGPWHAPMAANYQPKEETCIFPLLGWLALDIAIEAGVFTLTTGEAAALAVGITAGVTIVYCTTNPEPGINLEFPLTGDLFPRPPQGPRKPMYPDLKDLIYKITAGKMIGYLVAKQDPSQRESILAQLEHLNENNDQFQDLMTSLQAQSDTGKSFTVPVATKNGVRYRIFFPRSRTGNTGFEPGFHVYDPIKESWTDLVPGQNGWMSSPSTLSPGLAAALVQSFTANAQNEWAMGLRFVGWAFKRLMTGIGTEADYALSHKFFEGNIQGDFAGAGKMQADMGKWALEFVKTHKWITNYEVDPGDHMAPTAQPTPEPMDIFELAKTAVRKLNANQLPTLQEMTALKMTVKLAALGREAIEKLARFIGEELPQVDELPEEVEDVPARAIQGSNIYEPGTETVLLNALGQAATFKDLLRDYTGYYLRLMQTSISKPDLEWMREIEAGLVQGLQGRDLEHLRTMNLDNLPPRTRRTGQ